MKEYKIIKKPFSWTNAQQKFEDELNRYAKQGWQVVEVYHDSTSTSAILEKDKNR